MAERYPQSTTIRVPLQAYLASDHVTPATGKTIAITISKNGGAYGNPSGGATNATEVGSGSYYVDLSTTDTGTLGPLFVKGAEATIDTIITLYSITNAHNNGFDGVPNATANGTGGLPVVFGSKNAAQSIHFMMINTATNTPQTGAIVSTLIIQDGVPGVAAGTVTEYGSGWYGYAATAGDMNATNIDFTFSATNCYNVNVSFNTK